jgi:hypothetical protein
MQGNWYLAEHQSLDRALVVMLDMAVPHRESLEGKNISFRLNNVLMFESIALD